MYLLIPTATIKIKIIFHNLHPTMYLLILAEITCEELSLTYLHPTMYLLIPQKIILIFAEKLIYIPLCIY